MSLEKYLTPINYFREVIKECPLALEAVKGLLQMGVTAREIQVASAFFGQFYTVQCSVYIKQGV